MADASPAADDVREIPASDEGQNPDGESTTAPEESEVKTFPEAYVKKLRNEASETRKERDELKRKLQEIEDAEKTELEKLTEKLATETAARKKAELEQTRLKVASDHGFESGVADFLTGSTSEEIAEQAEKLGELLQQTKATKPAAGFDGGARTTAVEKASPEKEHNAFLLEALGRSQRRAT